MKKFQYIVVLLFVIVLGTGCSNDENKKFLSETENEIENKEDGVIYEVYTGNWSMMEERMTRFCQKVE